MQKDRLLVFLFLSLGFYLLWGVFVIPLLTPPKKKVDPPQGVTQAEQPEAKKTEAETSKDPVATGDQKVSGQSAEVPKEVKIPSHPHQEVVLGDLDRVSNKYRMQVTLDSRGAAIQQIQFSDPKYREGEPPYAPLKLFSPQTELPLRTLDSGIPVLDIEFEKHQAGVNSRTLDWEVVPESKSDSVVEFRLKSLDGETEVVKRYELQKPDVSKPETEREGYEIKFSITMKNLSGGAKKLSYRLTGPVGLVIESPFYTREFQSVVVGFEGAENAVTAKSLRVDEVVKQADDPNGSREQWKQPLKYIGVSVQFFTALLMPMESQIEKPFVASSSPELVYKDMKDVNHSQVSVGLTSIDLSLPAAEKGSPQGVTHEYMLYAGPKRPDFLRPVQAEGVVQYGMSGGLGITQFMHGFLNFLHGLFPAWAWPWGWAIILLTISVRLALLPLSMKQARSAARMQELQPELAALKKKYATDKEKFAREQWDLFKRNKVNPLGGCLPLLLQFPIIIGMYQALSISVDLRMAEFLWIKNLAAPDALFQFPFVMTGIPFPIFKTVFALGPSFNLLPIITVGLFIVQQKLFMPPAMDEEQKMQQKMMTYMMIPIGLMMYGVPAGLCVYFITSSVWGIVERKSLPKIAKKNMPVVVDETVENGSKVLAGASRPATDAPKNNWLSKLQDWADDVSRNSSPPSKGKKKK